MMTRKEDSKRCKYCGTKDELVKYNYEKLKHIKTNLCIKCNEKYIISRTCLYCGESDKDKLFVVKNKEGTFLSNICKKCRSEKVSKGAKGKPKSDEHKRILSKLYTGCKLKQETKDKIREKRALQKIPRISSIEFKIRNFLDDLKINYKPQKYIKEIKDKYRCDIFIPSISLIIECDGDYWHGNPEANGNFMEYPKRIREQRIRDFERTSQLEEKGYQVIRLWEHEIKKISMNEFKKILNKTRKDYNDKH